MKINPEWMGWLLLQLQNFAESGDNNYAGVEFYNDERMLIEIFIDEVQMQYRMRVFDWHERIEPRLCNVVIVEASTLRQP